MTGPLIDFTKPRADNRKFLREITTWVEDRLPDSMDDVTVMVNEMQCFEPGCPPLETVVTLLAGQSIVFKLWIAGAFQSVKMLHAKVPRRHVV